MANFLPDAYRNLVLGAGLNLGSLTIKAMFIDNADDTVTTSDDFLNDIASAARVPALGSCPTLGSKTAGVVAVGVFDAADTVFTALSGDPVEQLVILNDTATESTSNLVAVWDVTLTPNGGDVTVQWNASGIHKF